MWSCISFIGLPSMVGYWSYMSFHDIESSMVVDCTWYWLLLMVYTWLISFDFFPNLQQPSKWVSYCLPYFTLNHDSITLTRVVIFNSFDVLVFTVWVSQDVYNVKKNIPKLVSIRLTGFWGFSLFNYPCNFTPTFPFLNLLDWDGTKGVPS